MCGIVGYIGSKQASPVLIEGLERLSYRGYDSAGVAVIGPEGRIRVRKAKGRLENLKNLLAQSPVEGVIGIGHTRWATHGEPSDLNAHPHTDVKGGIAVVHNGIIENHESLRRYLESTGARFISQTDTEVIAHLLNHLYQGDMRRALIRAMGMLEGSYALGVICDQEPNALFCARNDSPLVIGAKDGEGFIASDIPALLSHTRDVIFLQDKEIGVLDRQGVSVYDAYGKTRQHAIFHVDWDLSSAEKGGYAHYMLKEQPCKAPSRPGRARRVSTAGCQSPPRRRVRFAKSALWRAGRPTMRGCWGSTPSSGWRVCPWRLKSPVNTVTVTPSWAKTSCSSPYRKAARRPTPWPPCAKPSAGEQG